MSKKDYKQGMADALEANKGFSEKQEAAINHVAGEVEKAAGKMDKLGDKIGEIKNYITDQEKAALYKLNTPVDIAALENNEKRILLAVLYQLSSDEDELTEEQQSYVRAVQQYLKIYNPQTEIDLEAVENIEDIAAQKAVLQTVLEFFYLGTHPGTYSEDQLEFLDCFQVNRKTRREISDHIKAIVEAVGVQGLAEKYGFVATQPQSDFVSYADNGEIPEKVADSFVALRAAGGMGCFYDEKDYLDTAHYIVFFRNAAYGHADAEENYQLFRMNKRTGEISPLPINYEKDLPFHGYPFNFQYHVHGDMLYLIVDNYYEEGRKSIHPIAVDVDKLTCRTIPLEFKVEAPFNRFPHFHLSGDNSHLVIYSFIRHPKKPSIKIHIVDLMENRTFLVEPDMIVRDAFWWDGSLMLLGRQGEDTSIFRYDLLNKTATNIFEGEYASIFGSFDSFNSYIYFGLQSWVDDYENVYIITHIDCIKDKYYFLAKHIHKLSTEFRLYTPELFDDGHVRLDEILFSRQIVWKPTFYFREGKIFQEDINERTFREYDRETKESTQIDKGASYLLLGDWLYKYRDRVYYKANISKGTDKLQWEVLSLPEEDD